MTPHRPLRLRLRGFLRDRRGASALEFALIAPMMIVVFMGLVETSNVVIAGRRSQHAANALGDLVAQESKITNSDMADTFSAAQAMIAPLSTTSLKMKITCVALDSKGKTIVQWSDPQGLPADVEGATYTGLPAGLLSTTGDSACIATAKYTLVQISKQVIGSDIAYTRVSYAKPRYNTVIRDRTT